MKPEVRVHADVDELSRAAARWTALCARQAVSARGRFFLMISGGTTPAHLFDTLAQKAGLAMPWDKTEIYWADERVVPPTDPSSNFRLAQEHLFSRVSVPEAQLHRIQTELGPSAAAYTYRDELLRISGLQARGADQPPVFDLIWLGIGKDGHTASLFPGSADLDSPELAVAVRAPAGVAPTDRVSVTLNVLNNARCAAFLVSGADKRDVVGRILADEKGRASELPVARVHGLEQTIWFVDRAAFAG